jgi:hypothetical protein
MLCGNQHKEIAGLCGRPHLPQQKSELTRKAKRTQLAENVWDRARIGENFLEGLVRVACWAAKMTAPLSMKKGGRRVNHRPPSKLQWGTLEPQITPPMGMP